MLSLPRHTVSCMKCRNCEDDLSLVKKQMFALLILRIAAIYHVVYTAVVRM